MTSLAVISFFSIFGVLWFPFLVAETEILGSYNYKHTGRNRGFRRSTRTITRKVGDLSITTRLKKFLAVH